jgi:hypothetical protein
MTRLAMLVLTGIAALPAWATASAPPLPSPSLAASPAMTFQRARAGCRQEMTYAVEAQRRPSSATLSYLVVRCARHKMMVR